MSDQHDEFTEAMWEHMKKVNELATAKIRALRVENKQLRDELKARDPELWELSEQIQALEMRLQSRDAQILVYDRALDKIIADENCDQVQVAHEAITPYRKWRAVSAEVSASIDAAVGLPPPAAQHEQPTKE